MNEQTFDMVLSADNYYTIDADENFLSVSQYKNWMKCGAASYAQYVEHSWYPETSDAMILGQLFHSLFEGNITSAIDRFNSFLADNPDLALKSGEPKAPAKQIWEMFLRVSKDTFFMNAVSGEHERIFTAELFGVMWKARVDVIDFDKFGGFFCDIKSVRDFEPVWSDDLRLKVPFYIASKYDIQLAVYEKIIELATGCKLSKYIAAVTKEKVPDFEVYDFNSPDMDTHFAIKLGEVKQGVETIQAIKSGDAEKWRCGHCEYCRKTKVLKNTVIALC